MTRVIRIIFLNFSLIIEIFLFVSSLYVQMDAYTEDVQNALADLENGVALATAATHHGVSRNTLITWPS